MVELLDVLEDSGKPTGVTKSKLEIIRNGDWRKVIHIWVVDDDGNLLIQQRAHGRGIFDDMWDVSVGGGVSAGEDSPHAAKRELHEELGLDLPESELKFLGTWKQTPKPVAGKGVMKDFSDTYLVLVPKIDLEKLRLAHREVQAVDKIELKKLSEKIKDPVFYANWVRHGQDYYQDVIAKILAIINSSGR